ncbi:MAG TPA: Bax inhibitor-1/YccA family protein [Spongiibacteraceae bacterium]|nr:Bax inhibitor-1/YccA family protein [Spongiibacteraceae bacterium]
MQEHSILSTTYSDSAVAVNKVVKNTYLLLAMTLAFSAFTAFLARDNGMPNIWIMIGGTYGLLFLTQALANSAWGLAAVFAFTGFMGAMLGPLLSAIMKTPLGASMVMQALGGTAIIFFALSGYALVSRKDFAFLQGFLFAGSIVLILAMVAGIFLHMPALQLAINAGFMLFASAMILFETSAIIHGGERNYIRAAVALYVSIYNLFMSLLSILMSLNGNNR